MQKFLTLFLIAAGLASAGASDDSFRSPDSLTLKDGSVHRGLIILNTRDSVTIQCEFEECVVPKSNILRIDDSVDALYTEAGRRGDLPAWRVIANDLRTHDGIKTLEEIPATLIDTGVFENVPYKSFRVNHDIELNIYGDPNDPAAIELGIYGRRSGDQKLRRFLRSYIAGYLTSTEEVAALYSLGLKEGSANAGMLTVEIAPPDAPDAYGAWWISLYNKKDLAAARLDAKEYATLVRPMDEVIGKDGKVLANAWSSHQADMMNKKGPMVIRRGFYRDKDGAFRLLSGE